MTFRAPTLTELVDAAHDFGAEGSLSHFPKDTLVEHVVAIHEPWADSGQPGHGVALSWWNGKKEIPKAWIRGVLIASPGHNADAIRSAGGVIFARRPRLVFGKLIEKFFRWYVPPCDAVRFGERRKIARCLLFNEGQALEWASSRLPPGTAQGWFEIPHLYGICIGDDVTIGSGSTIQRGLLNDTVIDDDVKIGPGVNIGHGAYIGKHSVIAAHACLGGSVHLEHNVMVGMNATIKNGVRIGAHATVGMGAVVLQDVNSGVTVVGNPAKVLLK